MPNPLAPLPRARRRACICTLGQLASQRFLVPLAIVLLLARQCISEHVSLRIPEGLPRESFDKGHDGQEIGSRRALQQTAGNPSSCINTTVCGGSVFQARVLDIVDSTACSYDEGLGLHSCGDLLLSSKAFETLRNQFQCTSGQDFCLDSQGNRTSEEHYWNAGQWGRCPTTCGPGIQQRNVECIDSATGRVVPSSSCTEERPAFQRPCNQLSCELQQLNFEIVEGSPGECSKACGRGWQEVHSFCLLADGFMADMALCPANNVQELPGAEGPAGAARILPCNNQACTATRWELGPWSMCNATCGDKGGFMTRTVKCFDQDNNEVALSLCPGEQPRERRCNTQPCWPTAWYTKPWVEGCVAAEAGCGPGEQSREEFFSKCIDSLNRIGGPHRCPSPAPVPTLACRNVPDGCPKCEYNCHRRGECGAGGICRCNPGWRGRFCEIPKLQCPVGVLDEAGSCCQTGMVDRIGKCCESRNATLDRRGDCCKSGQLDANGECDGNVLYVDIGKRNCTKGPPDAQGVSCEDGEVDECGVCNGFGASCALKVGVALLSLSQNGQHGFHQPSRFAFETYMAEALRVDSRQVSAESVEQFSRSNELGATQEGFRAVFVVSPPPQAEADEAPGGSGVLRIPVPSTGAAYQRLEMAKGALSASGAFFSSEILSVARAPVCGNGICEIGERPVSGGNGLSTSCEQDCHHAYTACPAQVALGSEVPCGARGICFTVSGQCGCFEGHRGSACEDCIPGWVMHRDAMGRNVCVKQSASKGSNALTANASAYLIALGIGATFAAVVIVGFTIITKGRAGGLWPKPEPAEHQPSHLSQENEGSQQGRPHGGSHRTMNPPGSQLGAASEVSERSGISPNPTAMSQYEMAQQSARQLDSIMHKRTTSLPQGSYGKGSHNPAMSRIANNLLGQRQSSSSREIPRGINPHEPKKRGAKKNRSRTAIGEDTSPADRQKGVRKSASSGIISAGEHIALPSTSPSSVSSLPPQAVPSFQDRGETSASSSSRAIPPRVPDTAVSSSSSTVDNKGLSRFAARSWEGVSMADIVHRSQDAGGSNHKWSRTSTPRVSDTAAEHVSTPNMILDPNYRPDFNIELSPTGHPGMVDSASPTGTSPHGLSPLGEEDLSPRSTLPKSWFRHRWSDNYIGSSGDSSSGRHGFPSSSAPRQPLPVRARAPIQAIPSFSEGAVVPRALHPETESAGKEKEEEATE